MRLKGARLRQNKYPRKPTKKYNEGKRIKRKQKERIAYISVKDFRRISLFLFAVCSSDELCGHALSIKWRPDREADVKSCRVNECCEGED